MGTTTATSLAGERATPAQPPRVPQQPIRGRNRGRGTPRQRRTHQLRLRLRDSLRLPAHDDPAPHPARMIGICAWAAALGLLGLPVAGRASVAIITGAAPSWFEPAVVTIGVSGIVLTAAAFAAIHRRWLPWLLLATATAPLSVNMTLTLSL